MTNFQRFAATVLICTALPFAANAQMVTPDHPLPSPQGHRIGESSIADPYSRGRSPADRLEGAEASQARCTAMSDRAQREDCESRLRNEGARIGPGAGSDY